MRYIVEVKIDLTDDEDSVWMPLSGSRYDSYEMCRHEYEAALEDPQLAGYQIKIGEYE